jgi:hypothetical protein
VPQSVALRPDGTAEFADAELMARLRPHVGADRWVLVFDPRGTGAVRPDPQLRDEPAAWSGPRRTSLASPARNGLVVVPQAVE